MKRAEKIWSQSLLLSILLELIQVLEQERRGQSEAIARNLMEMSDLKNSCIAIIIGEGSGGP